ncbi:anion permease [Cellulosimicrobium sp. 22601]|uniref:inorganic phosphate transporter n=1 Tax=unclassified Cellulosimicrobium TaxID=2624466 RepID=UPI003F83B017
MSGAVLTTCVVAIPLIGATGVARALHDGLVPAQDAATAVILLGFVVATGVVFALSRRGIPTSLTLALVGGVTGAALGARATIDPHVLLRVLIFGALAPLAGLLLAFLGSRLWRWVRATSYQSTVTRTHSLAFVLQSLAYGMNDGQKVLVLFFVATGHSAELPWWTFTLIGGAFAAGTAVGVRRMGRGGADVLSAHPVHIVTAELSAATAVIASSVAGAPVSMTQAITGGFVGTGLHDGVRRLRWSSAARVGLAWAITLPSTLLAGAAVSAVAFFVHTYVSS